MSYGGYQSGSSYGSHSFNNNNNNQNQQQLQHHDSPLREVPLFQSVRIRVGMKIIYTTMHTLQQSPTSVLTQLSIKSCKGPVGFFSLKKSPVGDSYANIIK